MLGNVNGSESAYENRNRKEPAQDIPEQASGHL